MNKFTKQKGITLIALIITVIVMLILVGVTINIAMNEGLFNKSRQARGETQLETDREKLYSAVTGAYDATTGIVDGEELETELGEGWTVTGNGPYTVTSPKGNIFTVETNGNIAIANANQGGNNNPGGNENPGEESGNEPDDPTPQTYAKATELTLGTNVRLVAYEDLTAGDIKTAVDSGKVSAVIEEKVGDGQSAVTYTAVVPVGYTVSSTENENTITKGLVIYDGTSSNRNNEFVWIPVPAKDMKVATTSDQYVGASNKAEPKELTGKDGTTSSDASTRLVYDSQEELIHYYGTKEDGKTPYFTYPNNVSDENNVTDFSYGVHYKEMAQSVNKYGGFYVGRYETTIDSSNNVGSKYNTELLVSNKILRSGTNENANTGGTYIYRWWGLYYAQRHANIAGNGSTVQTNMIWGQQWDKMTAFLDSQNISYTAIDTTNTYNAPSSVLASGQATYTSKTDSTEIKDKIFNIYDLRMNAYDLTAEASTTNFRVMRGSACNSLVLQYGLAESADYRDEGTPNGASNDFGSRLSFYIM